MPRRNTRRREFRGPHHVYNRAAGGRAVFRSDADRDEFLAILASRVSLSHFSSSRYRKAALVLGAAVSSYCLMTTHFHLIVWQSEIGALRRLLSSVMTAYVRYYNRRYGLTGPLFAGPFRSRPLTSTKELLWATAYVHANHPSGPGYAYSSHRAFVDEHARPPWLAATHVLEQFGGTDAYSGYMHRHAERATLNREFF